MRKYPILFGMLLSISAHAVIAMGIYTAHATPMNDTKKIIDFSLIDLKWEEPQEKIVLATKSSCSKTKPQSTKKKYSATKSTSATSGIPVDLTPSIYNEMPTYPETAKHQNIESHFTVTLILDKGGHVTQIIFQTNNPPPPILKTEVINKLSKWKFTSNQNLENIQINVPIQFKLNS